VTRVLRFASVAVVGVLLAAGCSLPGAKTGPMKLTATFDDVGDLVVDHAVQIADVRVGSITKIELTSDYRAKVTMSLDRVDLPADAIAELRTTSLLGEKFIQLRPCDPTIDVAPDANGVRRSVCTGTKDKLQSGTDIARDHTKQAPELESVADQAVQLLGGVMANDVATLVETGSVGFGGRAGELRSLISDLATISSTLADQSNHILGIIDGLDKATGTLSASNGDLDQLLVNLQQTTTVLADQRQQAVDTLQALTRLAQDQDTLVFEPYLQQVNQQIQEIDRILSSVTDGRAEVANLLEWVQRFAYQIPLGVPVRPTSDTAYAQIYLWFVVCPTQGC
jgi:phospholipid/cholesterol/gamma-HCH transport system substrate-binding protein